MRLKVADQEGFVTVIPRIESYSQPTKNLVRSQILEHAVNALTRDRSTSPVVTRDDFKANIEYILSISKEKFSRDFAPALVPSVKAWLKLYKSQVAPKSPQSLRVLILAGPEPLNDIEELMKLGVLPQNIWAIEGESKAYESAKKALLAARLPVKLLRCSLHEFFEAVPQQFDLVYFDACGALLQQTSDHVLRELFVNQRLTPLSVLITNFRGVDSNDDDSTDWTKRLAAWYAARWEEPIASENGVYARLNV